VWPPDKSVAQISFRPHQADRVAPRSAMKSSLFYKTKRGARVSDLFMSLIHTCQLSEVNAFEYLTVLQQNADHLAREPGRWMPWNYAQTLAIINDPFHN
jgi:hypothetical protein